MQFEKTVKMTVDADLVKRKDGKKNLQLKYILEEGKGRHLVKHGLYSEIVPYEKLLEIQKQNKRRSA